MKYLNLYTTMTGYTEASPTFSRPHVSYIVDEDLVIYDDVQPEKDWSNEYLTLEALTPGKFNYAHQYSDVGNMYFSRDNGNTWASMGTIIDGIDVQSGDKIMFKSSEVFSDDNGCGKFSSTCQFNAMGNPCSVLYGDNFSDVRDLSNRPYAFKYMFQRCTGLTSAENISLPATTLAKYCYFCMFAGCTSLTTAPELPATTLANSCYYQMFYGCTSLATAPELPATTLADSCYSHMFQGCTSLTTAPALPATALTEGCYGNMFLNCTSLTEAPALPATTLARGCYGIMFEGCTSLTEAPALPATTLAQACYTEMFSGCTSLTTAPELPATTLASSCYQFMFAGCTSLNYIKMLATDVSATSCLNTWVNGVSATGTFVKHPDATLPSGKEGIPAGWTVQTATE